MLLSIVLSIVPFYIIYNMIVCYINKFRIDINTITKLTKRIFIFYIVIARMNFINYRN